MRRLLLAALLGGLAAPAAAQAVLRPGAPGLAVDSVAAADQRFTIRMVRPMERDIGTLHRRLTVAGGVATLVSRASVPMANQEQSDSLRAAWPSLEPLTHHSVNRLTREAVFDPETAFLSQRFGTGPAEASETRMAPGGFFDLAWVGVLAQALPHAEGYAARVVAYDAERVEAVESPVTVTGRETRPTPAGPREAWVVDTRRGGQTTTYFVDAETRALLGLRLQLQGGVVVEAVPAE